LSDGTDQLKCQAKISVKKHR